MQQPEKFPFDIREVEEHENEELSKYFLGIGKSSIQVGPKKYLLISDYKDEAETIYNMPLRSDDVFIVTYPRSGTTWTQEIVWLLAYNLDYNSAVNIPLQERSVFLEFSMIMHKDFVDKLKKIHVGKEDKLKALDAVSTPGTQLVETMPSPRIIKTHLPMSLMPPTMLDNCKVVYVARDPRDVAVSFYHLTSSFQAFKFTGDFKTYWSFFVKDLMYWSPFFDHLKEAWEMRHHPNMMFLFYEELTQNLSATVKRIAEFLGKEYTGEQFDELCTHLQFDNFKKNPSVGIDNLKELGIMEKKGEFIRKGKSGGWPDYFDEEMTREAEEWIAKNLENTDMRFPTVK